LSLRMMCLKIVALICIQFGFGWTLVNKHNPMWPQVSYPHGGPDVDQASIFQRGLCDGSLKCMVAGALTPCPRKSAAPRDLCECRPAIEEGHEYCVNVPPGPPSVCGNGFKEVGEACDDGNVGDNDGCSGVCVFEEGFECTAQGLDFDLRGGLVCTRICDAFTSSPYCPVL
jgi:cysteine-rich repeat protein